MKSKGSRRQAFPYVCLSFVHGGYTDRFAFVKRSLDT